MVYMYHSFLIHSSADGHLGCFHVLAMINSAVMNIGVQVSLSDLVSLVCMPRSKDHYSILTHIYGILKDDNDNPMCKTEKETQMYRTDF